MPLCKVLVLASLLAIVASITASRLPSNFQQQQRQRLTSARTVKDTTTAADNSTSTGPSLLYQQCSSQYAAFLPGIHKDLLLWAPTGIDAALMDKAFTSRTYYGGRAGIPLVVHQGALYVVGNRSAEGVLPWHRQELLEYVVVLRHLLSKHGTSIPDVDLVLLTNDEPEDLLTGQQPRTTPPLPYFRWVGGCVCLGGAATRAPIQLSTALGLASRPTVATSHGQAAPGLMKDSCCCCVNRSSSSPPPSMSWSHPHHLPPWNLTQVL